MDDIGGNLLSKSEDISFHHIGWATGSIEKEREYLLRLGYAQEGEEFSDATQGIRGCFLNGLGPRIELLENLSGSDTLTPWLDAGVKMYHMAYLTESLEETLTWIRSHRAKVIVEPVPAVAFGGRRISFVMLPNRFLVEFIET
ncbi:MAG: VOC family protein [Parvibaculaceae bacterium]